MANMIVRYKVMPQDGEIETSILKEKSEEVIKKYDTNLEIRESVIVEVGFGLKAIEVEIKFDENLGSENLENNLNDLEEVGDVQVLKMDRL
jgi:translation elongation factor aEF-1 beta